jgi:hypothetical protein
MGMKSKDDRKQNAMGPLFSTIILAGKLLKVILIGLRIERPHKSTFYIGKT